MQNPVATATGPTLVLGAAGTGKTTALVAAVAERSRLPGPLPLVLTSTRQAASEIRDRVIRVLGETSLAPQVMTVHALCLSLTERYAADPDLGLLSAPEQEFRIRALVAGSRSGWPAELQAAVGTQGFARQVRAVLARARQLGLDPDDVAQAGVAAGELEWVAVGRFMAEYLDVLDSEQVLDYAELVHRARILCENSDVLAAIQASIGAVYVDEWCELDPSQIGLVRALAPMGVPVVALADPDTSVFGFRGAHPRAISAFMESFTQAGIAPQVEVLQQAHRRTPAEVEATARVAQRLGVPVSERSIHAAYREVVPGGEGRIEVCTLPDAATQARYLAGELRQAQLSANISWGDMAVLVRSSDQLVPLARALTDANIPVEIAGDEIGLADELAVQPLLLGLEVAGAGGRPDPEQARRLLASRWGGLDSVEMRRIGRRLREQDPDALGRPVIELLAEILAGSRVVPAGEEELERCRDLLARATQAIAGDARPEQALWMLWSGTPWPEQLRLDAVSGGEPSPRANQDLDAVGALFALAARSEGPGGAAGVAWFLAEVAQQQIPADSQREASVSGRGVRLLTAHRAKGQHWTLAAVAGVQEGIWPDARRPGSLFDPVRLSTSGLGLGLSSGERVAAERRLFLLACTRAEGHLLVTAVSGTDGEDDRPSRFLSELGVPVRQVMTPPARLHTIRDLVIELRRTAVDPEVSPGLRAAAAARLARLADATDDRGDRLVTDADPDRWWGVRAVTGTRAPSSAATVRLSPSQVERLLACPRQYYLSREARSDPPRPAGALLGSVIHALVERAATHHLGPDQLAAALDAVWADIPFPAAWLSASERAEADAAVERFLAWQAGNEHAELVGVEVPFHATVRLDDGPVELTGVVDRLERLPDGSLRIIDFKTSRTMPTRAVAAAHPQLGVYQLAVHAGGFEEHAPGSRTSAGAQLVFLRHDDGNGWPKVLRQPSLMDQPHLAEEATGGDHPTWVHERISQARAILSAGQFDARPSADCRWCPVRSSCPARSGQVLR
ncbi:MAG: ATP-dependent helicase [Propioniciclava sp.]